MMVTGRSKEIAQESFTSWADNGKTCKGCVFAEGDTPFDNAPDKCSCMVYPYPKVKPDAVFLEGKPCKYHREAVKRV